MHSALTRIIRFRVTDQEYELLERLAKKRKLRHGINELVGNLCLKLLKKVYDYDDSEYGTPMDMGMEIFNQGAMGNIEVTPDGYRLKGLVDEPVLVRDKEKGELKILHEGEYVTDNYESLAFIEYSEEKPPTQCITIKKTTNSQPSGYYVNEQLGTKKKNHKGENDE